MKLHGFIIGKAKRSSCLISGPTNQHWATVLGLGLNCFTPEAETEYKMARPALNYVLFPRDSEFISCFVSQQLVLCSVYALYRFLVHASWLVPSKKNIPNSILMVSNKSIPHDDNDGVFCFMFCLTGFDGRDMLWELLLIRATTDETVYETLTSLVSRYVTNYSCGGYKSERMY